MPLTIPMTMQPERSYLSSVYHAQTVLRRIAMTCPDWFCDKVANNLRLWGEAQDKMNALGIFQYVDTLMAQLERWRKEWSRNGALLALPGEPRHWDDPNIPGESYWDPCNMIYARAMEGPYL